MTTLDKLALDNALSTLRNLEHKARDEGADILGDRLEVAVGYVMDAVDEIPAALEDAA